MCIMFQKPCDKSMKLFFRFVLTIEIRIPYHYYRYSLILPYYSVTKKYSMFTFSHKTNRNKFKNYFIDKISPIMKFTEDKMHF